MLIADRMDRMKNAARQIIAFLMPKDSARTPVSAVKTTPPIPVETVIIAVAVAFLSPEKERSVVKTHG